MPDPAKQRGHARHALEIDIVVQIMIPEDTFAPKKLDARTTDVSARGMQIHLHALTGDLYARLLSRSRHARVIFDWDGGDKPIQLTGRIAWIDYHRNKKNGNDAPCNIGIFFDEQEEKNLSAYMAFFESLDAAA